MECTQRLECTQDLYESRSERICPEQIGFLGICGVKHPVKRGPNKIGRDPQTCTIVLNLNSISRQHAVINVINQREYMLMDLDSANKTKLMNKTLPAYIPHPLQNGDMVQFGDVFGVFRLLEEDTDLPMTQAIDMPETQVPETPVSNRHVSKINKVPITNIPESPDVSDKDDSFIVPSQPKRDICFRSSNSHFVKPSAKVISIQPIGTNKIDNIYWNSSKKSVSLSSQFNVSDNSLNDSTLSDNASAKQSKDKSIYELETQPAPCEADDSTDSIYTANTQIPPTIHSADTQVPASIHNISTQDPSSIHTANTQDINSIHSANAQIPASSSSKPYVPSSIHIANTQAPCISPSIHSINTQLPTSNTNLPEVHKIDNQQDMQFDLYASSKKKNNDFFDAETQPFLSHEGENETANKIAGKIYDTKHKSSKSSNVSAEEIVFQDMDCGEFEHDFESQALLSEENVKEHSNTVLNEKNDSNEEKSNENKIKNVIIHSDSSTDCEDIDMLPTQKITAKQDNEDVTDCEDLFEDEPKNPNKDVNKAKETKNDNFEDMLTQVIGDDDIDKKDVSNAVNKTTHDVNFEDMLTQVIVPEDEPKPNTSRINLEDMPTQIIIDESEDVVIAERPIVTEKTDFEDLPTQIISVKSQNVASQDLISPFKVPLMSPLKAKRKDTKVNTPKSKPVQNKFIVIPEEDNYYAATQDILEDLCTQPNIEIKENIGSSNNSDDEFLPSSVEDYTIANKFPHLKNNMSPKNKTLNRSFDSSASDGDENINNFVSKLSSQQIRDVIGVDKIKRIPSDPSDVELTPKKVRPIKFMDIDLPNSQEIKTTVSMHSKTLVTESSSESEVENDSEECTPILFHKKKRRKINAKMDLTKAFAADALPTRVITRVRKPTNKFQNEEAKQLSKNILQPKFLIEQEDEIDKEIITENISRLKSKSEKSKNKDANKDVGQKLTSSEKIKDENEITKKYSKNSEKVTENHNSELYLKADKTTDDVKTSSNEEKLKDNSRNSKKTENDITPKYRIPESTSKAEISKDDDISIVATGSTKEKLKDNSRSKKRKEKVPDVSKERSIVSKSTRSTRNRRKVDDSQEKCSVPLEEDSQGDKKSKSSRKQNIKKTIDIDLTDEVVEIRRSRRQKPNEVKDSEEKSKKRGTKSLEKPESNKNAKPAARRGRPPKHARTVKAEQSAVYSLSSESGTDTPKSILKRPAPEAIDPPSPKRTRSSGNPDASLRATPAKMNKTQHVLFTAFPCEEVKEKLENLGAVVVTDVRECTVVLTLAVKRTFKLLCAVGLGRPIVGPAWVQACVDTSTIVDPWLYILKDEVAEKRFQFNLEKTLIGKRNFLNGFHLSSTPSVMPNAAEMKLIVESSGGTWREEGPQWICVSCSADKALWPALKRRGAVVVSTEFILGGVLRQRADITNNKL